MSNQIDGSPEESASPAGNRGKPKKLPDRKIVPLDTAPLAVPPSGLALLFAQPPLVGNEKREDFDRFFSAITAAAKPIDAIAWLYVWDVACYSWEIRRERMVKADIIKSAQMEFVSELLRSTNLAQSTRTGFSKRLPRLHPTAEAREWFKNPKSQPIVAEILADNGYDRSDILAEA